MSDATASVKTSLVVYLVARQIALGKIASVDTTTVDLSLS